MNYKIISRVISRGELTQKVFIKEEFILKRETKNHLNLIHGVIMDNNNYKFSTNNNLLVKVEDGKISTNEVVLKKQEGAVIYGIVLFENGTPAPGATVILNLINKNNGRPIPISFAFTYENGVFIFGINDTRYDYLINIVYN